MAAIWFVPSPVSLSIEILDTFPAKSSKSPPGRAAGLTSAS
jgi:hypothetical protein